MSETRHTPGPWTVIKYKTPLMEILEIPEIGFSIECDVFGHIDDEDRANAKLIAAAPEMLAALELVKKWMLGGQPGPHSDSVVLDVVESAIKKAKGE